MYKSTYVYVPKIAKLKLFKDMYIWGKTVKKVRKWLIQNSVLLLATTSRGGDGKGNMRVLVMFSFWGWVVCFHGVHFINL